ncbi:putative minor capsid protein [Streptococcus iniae]|uniref:putative minor capsid protein n=1 Tax=Streptococcus iniae TaxID=1346 RepID=UPI000EFD28FB|nr:putative minor capsid protein [Streptococcus iniae]RMI79783.1 capsid protein [Streptococcus iniae]
MIDKRLLKDVVTVSKKGTVNDFGDVTYLEPITLLDVRFDRNIGTVGTNNQKQRQKPGVIYVYPQFTKITVDNSWIDAKVNDGDRDYIVKGWQPNYLNGKLFSYEIEVI